MKATALAAAIAFACGTAAFAQQTQDRTARQENSASADSIQPADDAQRTKNAARNLGHKARNALHRAEDKVRDVTAKNDKDRHHDRHARAEHDRHHERHARADHDRMGHDHDRNARRYDDTRAMGAGAGDMRDADMARRQRMDDAYDNWKSKQRG